MNTSAPPPDRTAVILAPGEGRPYPMGSISAVFKADGEETAGGYSISEWWLEPHTQGPGAHAHPEDDTFYVLEGVMSFSVNGAWMDAAKGSFILVPGGSTHDFENRSAARAGILNFSAPGNFEQHMPDIAQWFAEHPPGRAGD
jgi:quercetin dioxygenase-like cupin family protein